MIKLYTRNGDHGKTAGKTIAANVHETITKSHPYIRLMGTIDELTAYLGIICAEDIADEIRKDFQTIQKLLLDLNGVIADNHHRCNTQEYWDKQTEYLEHFIDWIALRHTTPPYILSGNTLIAAKLHYARTIARRLEVEVHAYISKMVLPVYVPWVNRLSDYLYAYAIYVDMQSNGNTSFTFA